MSKSDATKISLPGAPPAPKPGAVIVNIADRRRERQNREVWLMLDEAEPLYRCIPVISRGHRDRLFSGFFGTDINLLRSLIHPDDRGRFDILVGNDLEWNPEAIPLVTSDGRPLLEADSLDEALNGALINFGVARQPDPSVIAQRVRDLLKGEDGLSAEAVNKAVAAMVAIINAEVELTGGEVVEEEKPPPPVVEAVTG